MTFGLKRALRSRPVAQAPKSWPQGIPTNQPRARHLKEQLLPSFDEPLLRCDARRAKWRAQRTSTPRGSEESVVQTAPPSSHLDLDGRSITCRRAKKDAKAAQLLRPEPKAM